MTVCHTSLHLHPHIFTCSHLHLFAYLLTSSISFFSSSHLHLFISSHHRQNLNLHVLTSPRHILKSSYHNIFFSSHPHLFTSSISFSSSYIFISSYLHTLYIIFFISFFFLRYLDIFLSLCFMLYHLLTYIFHYISLRSRAIRRLVFYVHCSHSPLGLFFSKYQQPGPAGPGTKSFHGSKDHTQIVRVFHLRQNAD